VKGSSTSPSRVKAVMESYTEHPVLLLDSVKSSRVLYQGILLLQQDDPHECEIVDGQVIQKRGWRSEKDGAKSKNGREKEQYHARKIPESSSGAEGRKKSLVSAFLQREGC